LSASLFAKNHKIVNDLLTSLNKECQHQREYLRLVDEERAAIHALKSQNIEECAVKRHSLIERIKQEQEGRITILKTILRQITSNRPELRITAIAERAFDPEDSLKIKEVCGILKELITVSKRKTVELEGMVNFSSKFVNGTIAAILAHSHKSIPVYNSNGIVSKQTQPVGSVNHHMSRLA